MYRIWKLIRRQSWSAFRFLSSMQREAPTEGIPLGSGASFVRQSMQSELPVAGRVHVEMECL